MSVQPSHGADGAARQLLDYLESERERRCTVILERAGVQAHKLEKEARHRALVLVREAVRRERRRREGYLREQRARIDAHFRAERFQRESRGLARARDSLVTALGERWQAALEQRRQWLAMAFDEAAEFLVDGEWHASHPRGWSTDEAGDALAQLSRDRPGVKVEFEPGDQGAGILIACGEAWVDARPGGLLAESARVDGLLLRALKGTGPGRDQ